MYLICVTVSMKTLVIATQVFLGLTLIFKSIERTINTQYICGIIVKREKKTAITKDINPYLVTYL